MTPATSLQAPPVEFPQEAREVVISNENCTVEGTVAVITPETESMLVGRL